MNKHTNQALSFAAVIMLAISCSKNVAVTKPVQASLTTSPGQHQPGIKKIEEDNKMTVIKMNRLFNEGKEDSAMSYYAESLTRAGNINGKSFFKAMQDDILQAFPDVQTKILELWCDGDWVIAQCLFTGTHKGIATLPHHGGLLVDKTPTEKTFKVQHIRMYKLVNGKITERRAIRDDLGMYQQLGLLPAPTAFKPVADSTRK